MRASDVRAAWFGCFFSLSLSFVHRMALQRFFFLQPENQEQQPAQTAAALFIGLCHLVSISILTQNRAVQYHLRFFREGDGAAATQEGTSPWNPICGDWMG